MTARSPRSLLASCLGIGLGLSATASASQDSPPPAEAPAAPASAAPAVPAPTPQSAVSLSISPYAWLTSFNGTIGARGVSSDVDASFFDLLEESDSIFALMGAVDLVADRFVLQFNAAYATAEIVDERGRARSGPLGGGASVEVDVDTETENLWVEAMAGYRVITNRWGQEQRNDFALDAFAGVRHTTLGLDVKARAEADFTLPGGEVLEAGVRRELSRDVNWFEPFVGARAAVTLDEHWVLSLRGDVGGFDVDGSTFAWQTTALAGYRWNYETWSFGMFAGYRALGQDYQDDEVTWDVVTHGPLLGFSALFRF